MRYIRGMFDHGRMSADQQRSFDLAVATLEGLAREGAMTFAIVDSPSKVTAGGRKPRRDRKTDGTRSIGPMERMTHAAVSQQAEPVTIAQTATITNRPISGARTSLYFLKKGGFAERINPGERIALYQVTDKPLPAAPPST